MLKKPSINQNSTPKKRPILSETSNQTPILNQSPNSNQSPSSIKKIDFSEWDESLNLYFSPKKKNSLKESPSRPKSAKKFDYFIFY